MSSTAKRPLKRPWCCPEPRCTPVYQQGQRMPWADQPSPGSSFLCFGQMAEQVEFVYDGTPHANDLRSCSYTPLKGVVAWQENAEDWAFLRDAYGAALAALSGSYQHPHA